MLTRSGMIFYHLCTAVLITIQFLETVRSTYPHSFDIYSTHNVTVTEGKQAILPCHSESNDEDMVVWMNPKKIIVSERESRYIDDPRMSVERPFVGDYNLHIRQVRYDDRGEYICNINSDPVQTKRIKLIIKVPSRFVHDGQRNEVKAVEGTTIRLTCNATGIPAPNITWFRRITENEEEKKEQVGTIGEVLIIYNISRRCGGVYECMAFNGVEPAISKSIKVEVQFMPEIIIRNRRLGQKKDKETMLECLVTASPQGDNYWKRGNLEISSNDLGHYRIEVYSEDEYTVSISLRILNVQDKDFGLYTCEAKNVLGVVSGHMELYEYVEPTLPMTTTTVATTTKKRQVYFETINNRDRNDQEKDYYGENDHTRRYPPSQVSGQIGTGEFGGNGVTQMMSFSYFFTWVFLLLKKIS